MAVEIESTTTMQTLADDVLQDWSARDVATSTFDLVVLAAWNVCGWRNALNSIAHTLAYTESVVGVGKRRDFNGRKRVDVDQFVQHWHEALVQMSTAHSHAQFTGAEHSTDELLRPLLTAPIAQMREFASKLSDALEHDERVPFMVWSAFKTVVAPLILKRPEGDVIKLKTTLAREIAELVEHDLPREDLIASIAGALQWRSLQDLNATRSAVVEQKATPRMRGRQSCLFLVTVAADGRELSNVIL